MRVADGWAANGAGTVVELPVSAGESAWVLTATGPLGLGSAVLGQSVVSVPRMSFGLGLSA